MGLHSPTDGTQTGSRAVTSTIRSALTHFWHTRPGRKPDCEPLPLGHRGRHLLRKFSDLLRELGLIVADQDLADSPPGPPNLVASVHSFRPAWLRPRAASSQNARGRFH